MSKSASKASVGNEVGNRAPDFELKDESGRRWRLSDHRGKVVALIFYPKDETTVCTKQMCSMRDRWSDYEETGAEVVAISIGSIESHKSFAEHHNLPQKLLADERGEVARLLDMKSLLGVPKRAVLVIDGDGIIRFRKVVFPVFRPTDDEVLAAIRDASST
jgi:peroxiredoxin Q/BCP